MGWVSQSRPQLNNHDLSRVVDLWDYHSPCWNYRSQRARCIDNLQELGLHPNHGSRWNLVSHRRHHRQLYRGKQCATGEAVFQTNHLPHGVDTLFIEFAYIVRKRIDCRVLHTWSICPKNRQRCASITGTRLSVWWFPDVLTSAYPCNRSVGHRFSLRHYMLLPHWNTARLRIFNMVLWLWRFRASGWTGNCHLNLHRRLLNHSTQV